MPHMFMVSKMLLIIIYIFSINSICILYRSMMDILNMLCIIFAFTVNMAEEERGKKIESWGFTTAEFAASFSIHGDTQLRLVRRVP